MLVLYLLTLSIQPEISISYLDFLITPANEMKNSSETNSAIKIYKYIIASTSAIYLKPNSSYMLFHTIRH